MKLIHNKKASVVDVGLVAVTIFIAAIMFLAADYTIVTFSDHWKNNTVVNSSAASITAVEEVVDLANTRFDYIIFVLLMGLTLGIIITGWMVAGNPMFSFFYFIVLVIFTILAAILSFVWNKITTTGQLVNVVGNFPITNFILSNFPTYIAIIGFIGMVVLFAKPR